MRKDLARSSGQSDRLPISRGSGFFSPWFDDYISTPRLFEDFFDPQFPALTNEMRSFAPAIDVDETDNEYLVYADLPGVKKEDVNIECKANQVTISAERKYETPEGKKSNRRERFYGSYLRSFTLPVGVDEDKIEASFDGGVLTLKVPKGEQIKAKRITINDAKSKTVDVKAKN